MATFKENDVLPEMVQLGNEISSGNFLQRPGADSETFTNYEPSYLKNKSNYSYAGTSGSENMKAYLNAGVNGVNDIDNSIKKVVHWAKGSSISSGVINSFFNSISSVNYDYAALSLYPYYCFDSISTLNSILSGLNISKPWFIAETSYPFSGYSWVYENSQNLAQAVINNWSTAHQLLDILKD